MAKPNLKGVLMNNVINARTFEVKTPDIVIKVNPERTDLIETRTIDGRECLVIELDGDVEVNGISVHTAAISQAESPA